jgi:hypothetical protein
LLDGGKGKVGKRRNSPGFLVEGIFFEKKEGEKSWRVCGREAGSFVRTKIFTKKTTGMEGYKKEVKKWEEGTREWTRRWIEERMEKVMGDGWKLRRKIKELEEEAKAKGWKSPYNMRDDTERDKWYREVMERDTDGRLLPGRKRWHWAEGHSRENYGDSGMRVEALGRVFEVEKKWVQNAYNEWCYGRVECDDFVEYVWVRVKKRRRLAGEKREGEKI